MCSRGVSLKLADLVWVLGHVGIDVMPFRQKVVKSGVNIPLIRGERLIIAPKRAEAIIGLVTEYQAPQRELAEELSLIAVAFDPVVGGDRQEQVELGTRDRLLLRGQDGDAENLSKRRELRSTAQKGGNVHQLAVFAVEE